MRKRKVFWKEAGTKFKCRPAVAEKEFARITERHGELTAEAIVSEARNRRNPLHQDFEWNDGKAAEKFRLQQAGDMMRALRIEYLTDRGQKVNTRLLINVAETKDSGTSYHHIKVVLSDREMRERAVDAALARLLAVKREYEHLKELADVFRAIERVAKKRGA